MGRCWMRVERRRREEEEAGGEVGVAQLPSRSPPLQALIHHPGPIKTLHFPPWISPPFPGRLTQGPIFVIKPGESLPHNWRPAEICFCAATQSHVLGRWRS